MQVRGLRERWGKGGEQGSGLEVRVKGSVSLLKEKLLS